MKKHIIEKVDGTLVDPIYGNRGSGFLDPQDNIFAAYRLGSNVNPDPLIDLIGDNPLFDVNNGGFGVDGYTSSGTTILRTEFTMSELFNSGDTQGMTAIFVVKAPSTGGSNHTFMSANAQGGGAGNVPFITASGGTDVSIFTGATVALRGGVGSWRNDDFYILGAVMTATEMTGFRARFSNPINFRNQDGGLKFAQPAPVTASNYTGSTRKLTMCQGNSVASATLAAAAYYSGPLTEHNIEKIVQQEFLNMQQAGLI